MSEAERIYRAHPDPAEIADVLALRETATVGTVNPDGSVHLAYVIFLHRDGLLYFETSSVTRKARNIRHTGQVSMIVQGRASSGRHLMVGVEGDGRLLHGDDATRINHELRAKYIRPEALAEIDQAWNAFDDVAIEVTPQRWRSWHGDTMHEVTQTDLTMPYGDIWLD